MMLVKDTTLKLNSSKKKRNIKKKAMSIWRLITLANVGHQKLLVIPDQVRLYQQNALVYWPKQECFESF